MFKQESKKQKTNINRYADFLTNSFGTVWFLLINAIIFLVWIVLNSGLITGIEAFDPYPYGLLTTIVSLEAIALSIIVLITQNRTNKLDKLREELDLEINIKAESEITRIINMLDEIHDHLGLPAHDDKELTEMKHKTNINKMKQRLMDIKN